VIIPCRNHAEALARCLDSVMTQTLDAAFEVIVVDAGVDERVAAVVNEYPIARCVRSATPLLPGAARNLGAASSIGKFLVFIDADCGAEKGWLASAIKSLQSGARMVGGAVLHGEPWHPVAVIDNLMQFSDMAAGRPRGIARLLPSCNLALSRADFRSLGGFPSVTLPAGEDVLFSNAAVAKWPDGMLFEPTMQVRHFGRRALRQLWAHQELFGFVRAMYALELDSRYRRWGRFALVAPMVALKRRSYIAWRAACWQPVSLAAMTVWSPILIYAIVAWCAGFHRGCAAVRHS
jgi:glycosyltransferase involved in cell wall biosynthesis